MIDLRIIITIVFFIALTWYVYSKRNAMQAQKVLPPLLYFSMYRTTWGLKTMDSWAKKYARILNWLGISGVVIGFLGMVFICFALIKSLIDLLAKPEAPAGVGLVLPFKAKGIFYVPIEYWIICIFVIALVHEFSHGVLSRVYGVKVKASGFAFAGTTIRTLGIILIAIGLWKNLKTSALGSVDLFSSPDVLILIGFLLFAFSYLANITAPIIPAAFVEPDEKKLRKKPLMQQLAVFGAGPFSNVILGFLFLGLYLALVPIATGVIQPNGIAIESFVEGNHPSESSGLQVGDVITTIDGVPTPYVSNLTNEALKKRPGDTVVLKTKNAEYQITLGSNPANESKPFMGITMAQSKELDPVVKERFGVVFPTILLWMMGLFMFMFILNLGIGLFNLVPIGPLDGGRMLHIVLMTYMEKDKAIKLFGMIGMFFLIIVLMNVFFPFLKPLF
ncbi:MAG TPA: site-2 protease family protein [Candidatus Nanoarchaeia archaeon]|nr:site-2 protease family protein [Candidatus Nanoarchaeia archaeon]